MESWQGVLARRPERLGGERLGGDLLGGAVLPRCPCLAVLAWLSLPCACLAVLTLLSLPCCACRAVPNKRESAHTCFAVQQIITAVLLKTILVQPTSNVLQDFINCTMLGNGVEEPPQMYLSPHLFPSSASCWPLVCNFHTPK